MPDEELKEEEKKRPRGRPKKKDPEVPYNEEERELRMSEKSNKKDDGSGVTMKQVQMNLTQLYNQVYKFQQRGTEGGWFNNADSYLNWNPFLQNQRLKRITTRPNMPTSEQIATYLDNPADSEQPLRASGWALANQQYLYYKILRLACDVPMYNWYKTPELLLDAEEYKKDKFKKEDAFVDDWMDTFSPKNTLKRVALEVKREGKSSYLLRNSVDVVDGKKKVNYATFQKVPSEYCMLTAIGEYGYVTSFNLFIFMDPAFRLSQYPPYITDIWNDMMGSGIVLRDRDGQMKVDVDKLIDFKYKDENGELQQGIFESRNNRYLYWVQLPQKLCYNFASDTSHPWAVPDTIGLFSNLQDLADYNTLAGLIQSTPLTAILTGEIPIVNDPNPGADQTVLSPQTITGFQNEFNSMSSSNIEALFLPFKNIELQSLPDIPSSSEIVTKAVQNFVSQSGEGGILVATDKPSVAMIKGAQKLEEAQQDFVTRQFERVLNMIVNDLLGCDYEWKIHLWGGIYTYEDEMARMKEMWQNGATFMLPRIASGFDMTMRDITATTNYIESMDVYKNFKTLTQQSHEEETIRAEKRGVKIAAQTQKTTVEKKSESDTTEEKKVGRPTISDANIDNDSTAASRESGDNTSEVKKDYAVAKKKCLMCGVEVDEGEFLCEECKEEYKQQLEEEGVL